MHESKPPTRRRFLRSFQAACWLTLGLFTAHAAFGWGGKGLDTFFNDWVYNALILAAAASCIVRAAKYSADRFAWSLLGFGLVAWAAAEIYNTVYLTNLANPPYPSLSDWLWLSFYPASYIAMVMLVRDRMEEARASLWLDGVVAALAVCLFGEFTVFHTVAQNAIAQEGPVQVATDLAYPVGDMLMLAIVASVFALTAWRPGRAWTMIGLGLGAAGVADSIYAYQSSAGTYQVGTALDALWPAATLLVGFAAWELKGQTSEIRLDGWRILVLPGAFALPAPTGSS